MNELPLNYLPKEGVISLHEEERKPGYQASHLHNHDHEELLLVDSDCFFVLESNGRHFQVRGPAVILHRAGSFHEIVSVEGKESCRCLVIFFRSETSRKIPQYDKEWDMVCLECNAEEISSLLAYYTLMKNAENEERRNLLKAMLYRTDRMITAGSAIMHFSKERYLFELVHYLSEHYAEKNTLEDVSRIFHVSSGKLKKDFQHITGMTVKQFLSEIRFRRAAEYLQEEKKISDIAEDTGFSSESHFIAAFREHFGITPNAYRKSKKGEAL